MSWDVLGISDPVPASGASLSGLIKPAQDAADGWLLQQLSVSTGLGDAPQAWNSIAGLTWAARVQSTTSGLEQPRTTMTYAISALECYIASVRVLRTEADDLLLRVQSLPAPFPVGDLARGKGLPPRQGEDPLHASLRTQAEDLHIRFLAAGRTFQLELDTLQGRLQLAPAIPTIDYGQTQVAPAAFVPDPLPVATPLTAQEQALLAAVRAQVLEALASAHPISREAANGLVGALNGLDAASLTALVAGMTDSQLLQLNTALAGADGQGADGQGLDGQGLDGQGRRDLANALLPKLSADQLNRIGGLLRILQPFVSDPSTQWTVQHARLWDLTAKYTDINQGGVGDCWFVATLSSAVLADPQFVSNHLKDNGNGSYTVTFYDNAGKPVPVTVDSRVATSDGAVTFDGSAGASVLWPMIYEKALALYRGSFKGIDGGLPTNAIQLLTGKAARDHDADDVSLASIAQQLTAGRIVVAGTDASSSSDYADPQRTIVNSHAYTVVRVDTQAQTITLRNPWGHSDEAPEFLTITADKFATYFDEVSWPR